MSVRFEVSIDMTFGDDSRQERAELARILLQLGHDIEAGKDMERGLTTWTSEPCGRSRFVGSS